MSELEHWVELPLRSDQTFSLELCLTSGQSFAWRKEKDLWFGSIRNAGFLIKQDDQKLFFQASVAVDAGSQILSHYLALDENHSEVVSTFPEDLFLQDALRYCGGLRVLRQDPWECLAGFILSSTKQIIHIRQIWTKLCTNWGEKMVLPNGKEVYSFPDSKTLSRCSEEELRKCGMGFRAPYLLNAAKKVASNELCLEALKTMPLTRAREKLIELHGVGRKIADCVLLFSLDHADAFPVDTWILKVLKKIYFKNKRKVTSKRLIEFTETHFGPHAGHAQQYLFHYARMNKNLVEI